MPRKSKTILSDEQTLERLISKAIHTRTSDWIREKETNYSNQSSQTSCLAFYLDFILGLTNYTLSLRNTVRVPHSEAENPSVAYALTVYEVQSSGRRIALQEFCAREPSQPFYKRLKKLFNDVAVEVHNYESEASAAGLAKLNKELQR